MSDKNHDELAQIEDVDIEALTDDDLEDVAGGGCTCVAGSSGCSNGLNLS